MWTCCALQPSILIAGSKSSVKFPLAASINLSKAALIKFTTVLVVYVCIPLWAFSSDMVRDTC